MIGGNEALHDYVTKANGIKGFQIYMGTKLIYKFKE